MKKLAVVVLLTFVLAASRAAGADAMDDYIRAEMESRRIPGLTVAVVKDGALLKTRAYGLANLELAVPASPGTVYGIGSITKPFTALAILMLAGEGKVDLDAPIGESVKETPAKWRNATVRQLLSHTSGIPDFVDNPCRYEGPAESTHKDVLLEAACEPLEFSPGERFAYSNTNYLLLGMLVERVTGAPLDAFFASHIYTKLGMTQTRMVDNEVVVPGRADGYLWSVDRYVNVEEMDPVVEFASGGLLSTAGDMAKFMLALGDPVLLTEARWQEMWTRPEVREGETPYGLGFGLSPYEGRRRVGHNGAAPGFASALSWFPEERVGVVVLSNGYQEPLGRNIQDLANRIAALHFGD